MNDNSEKPESNYILHAKREFLAMGYDLNEKEEGPNKWIMENIFALLNEFSKQGHSGSSAPYCVRAFAKLALFEPLAPLTGEDSEWSDVSHGGDPQWQNNRCSHVFKSANGTAYDIDGYVFWHPSERPLDEDEPGFPGVSKYRSSFTSGMSKRLVKFPYSPEKPIPIEVVCFETNKETSEREPGSGWWETIYPPEIIAENEHFKSILNA